MVNLANSRGLLIPESRLFEQRFLDLCLSRAPDHPTYSAVCISYNNAESLMCLYMCCSDCILHLFQMIFIAITELNEAGGSCEEAISEFIKSKYESLPFAHTSLLSHHLAKLVEKREILCDYNSYCYTLPGTDDAERKSVEMPLIMNDQCAADEVMSLQNDKGTVEERILTESRTSPKRKACGGNDINFIEVSDTGGKACLSVTTVKTRSIEGVAVESEVALEKSGSEGGELRELVVLDEQNDVLMEESCKGEENLRERTSNTMKEACEEGKSVAYKRLWESQTEACSNIIALE